MDGRAGSSAGLITDKRKGEVEMIKLIKIRNVYSRKPKKCDHCGEEIRAYKRAFSVVEVFDEEGENTRATWYCTHECHDTQEAEAHLAYMRAHA
jgi:uncharacterized protein with PIN domain